MKKIKYPVVFEGRKFCGIRKFDCVIVDLYTEPTLRGGFFTSIPISETEYRREHPTKAKVNVSILKGWTVFRIYSDWGELSVMEIHNSLSDEIALAIEGGKRRGVIIN